MFTVYVIYNKRFRKTYVGFTSDLEKRILQHNEGFTGSYTSRFIGDWIVIYAEKYSSAIKARIREKQLKTYKGREFIKKYIPG